MTSLLLDEDSIFLLDCCEVDVLSYFIINTSGGEVSSLDPSDGEHGEMEDD